MCFLERLLVGRLSALVVSQLFLILMSALHLDAQTPGWTLAAGSLGDMAWAFGQSPGCPDTVFCLGSYQFLRSDNGGRSWDSISFYRQGPGAIAVHPHDRSILLMARADGPNITRLHRSSDGGRSWTILFAGTYGTTSVVEQHPTDPMVVFSVLGPQTLRKSVDFGVTWDTLGYPSPIHWPLYDLSVAPSDPKVIYAAMQSGLTKSTDGGETWTDVSPPFGFSYGSQVCVDPRSEDVAYVGIGSLGTTPGGMYKTTDGGQHWSAINVGLDSTHWGIKTVLVHPKRRNEIYVGLVASGNSLFRSTNAGASWHPFDAGLPRAGGGTLVQTISLNEQSDRLLVGAGSGDSSGIYYLDLATSVPSEPPRDSGFGLKGGTNFPNPFKESTVIEFQLREKGPVEIRVFDILGRLMEEFHFDEMTPGSHRIRLRFPNLGSGTYFLSLVHPHSMLLARLLLVR